MKPVNSIIKAGWTNFKRNSFLSFAVTGQMAIALLILLALASFQYFTSEAIGSIEGKLDVSAYFKIDAAEEEILAIKKDLEKSGKVAEVAYISRDQALAEFKERHKDEQDIQSALEELGGNPLPATLNIKANDPSQYGEISKMIRNHKYGSAVDDLEENTTVINRINAFARAVRLSGLLIALVVALIALFVTFNTVRLTIYNQKQEIEIMRLVGASNWHIRGPYIAEGGIYGAISALVALVVFYPITYAISDKMAVFIPGSNIFRYFLVNSWQIVLIILAIGILMGTVSSFIAIRKHLKI